MPIFASSFCRPSLVLFITILISDISFSKQDGAATGWRRARKAPREDGAA